MKKMFVIIALLLFVVAALTAQEMQAYGGKKAVDIKQLPMRNLERTYNAPTFTFGVLPTVLATSYYDYMIGSYTNLPIRVQTEENGGGAFMVWHGKQSASATRRVSYAFVNENGERVLSQEITSDGIAQGYPGMDVDKTSGIPIFAWHAKVGTGNDDFDVQGIWDSFLGGEAGNLSDTFVGISHPVTITSIHGSTDDNYFIWGTVTIGPSPLPDHRRVYIKGSNGKNHTSGDKPSENPYFAYADFTTDQLQSAEQLNWTYTSIPELNNWNNDTNNWRRPWYSLAAGTDGKLYYFGSHFAQDNNEVDIDEPNVDVFVNTNYGAGEWTKISTYIKETVANPMDYFTDDSEVPYDSLYFDINSSASGHSNAVVANNIIHTPFIASLNNFEGSYYPALQSVKDLRFNTQTNQFSVYDVYPVSAQPKNGHFWRPWDQDEDGIIDSVVTDTENGDYPAMAQSWPFLYWDEAAHDNAMSFHLAHLKISKANDSGWMAMVWQSSLNARMYNKYPTTYPELQPYANCPEIYISFSKNYGEDWSEPVVLNGVDTPELKVNGTPMICEWPYPADYIVDRGNGIGRLYMMMLNDDAYGISALAPNGVGQPGPGKVLYFALDVNFGSMLAADDPIAPTPVKSTLKQNYPNPFNPNTTISFNMDRASNVTLNVFNVKGQLVKTLLNGRSTVGLNSFSWDGTDNNNNKVASGVYYYTLKNGNDTQTKKMVLVK